MGSTDYSRLKSLALPPTSVSAQVNWYAVERRLGSNLPQDYKELVDGYGAGVFNEFIWLLTPDSPSRFLDLVLRQKAFRDALTESTAEGEPLVQQIKSPNQLLAWPITDNGDICYWLTLKNSPDDWPVIVNESRGAQWYEFPGCSAKFLSKVLAGKIVLPFFPTDFPNKHPTFRAYNTPAQAD